MVRAVLFAEKSVATEFAGLAKRVTGLVGDLTKIDSVEASTSEILSVVALGPTTLRRNDATFPKPGVTPEGTAVQLRVPFDGPARLFHLYPTSVREYRDGILGTVFEPSRWTEDKESHIMLSTTMATPNGEYVRSWGKTQVDEVESLLAAVNAEVVDQMRTLDLLVRAKVTERQKMLQARDGLGDLGIGI